MLDALGLDPVAIDVYRLMLAHPSAGVSDISARVGRPEEDVRAALDRLVEASLLRPSYDAPGQLRAVRPQVGLAALVEREQAELRRRQTEIERSKATVALLVAELAGPGKDDDAVRALQGLDAVRGRLEELATTVTSEVLSFSPGGAQSAQSLDASRPLNEETLQRGVSMRCLYLDSVSSDAPTRRFVQFLSGLGAQVRTCPTLPTRLYIADRRVALLPLDPADSRAGALEVSQPGAVAALVALFEAYWTQGTTFGQSSKPVPGPDALTPQERELLRLLADGAKDEAVSRALGVSVRTARRMIADLMTRLDAGSRFQAGVNAARAGWA